VFLVYDVEDVQPGLAEDTSERGAAGLDRLRGGGQDGVARGGDAVLHGPRVATPRAAALGLNCTAPQEMAPERRPDRRPIGRYPASEAGSGRWARLGSNQRPLACEASALPLSYAPEGRSSLAPASPDSGDTAPIAARRYAYGSRRDQFGELTPPEGSGSWPVVVLIHGGFWRARYGLRLEDLLVTDLAGRGWAVWNLEYRRLGLRSRGGWPATFEDVAAGIDLLGKLEEPLDLARVFGIGHSAGGQLALWAAARRGLPAGAPGADPSVRLAGAVAQAGVVDLREAARLGLSRRAAEKLLAGPPTRWPARYDLASPLERLPLGLPQLLVHGDADDVVPIGIARGYADRAAYAGDPCELLELAGCGHDDHLDPGSRAWAAVVRWLEER
jgi:acetyl esterase/lipase